MWTYYGSAVHQTPTDSIAASDIGKYWYSVDTGVANAYAVTFTGLNIPTLGAGSIISFMAAHDNTTASTVAINGETAKAIKKLDGATALTGGEIKTGQLITLIYDGTNFQLMGSGSGTIGGSTGSTDNAILRADGTGGATIQSSIS